MLNTGDFKWDEFFWTANVALREWPGSPSHVNVVFAPEGRGDEPLEETELGLVNWFLSHEKPVLDALCREVVRQYPEMQNQYGYSESERAAYMPDIASDRDLWSILTLLSVYVHPLFAGGVPYLGFEFDCTWDEEHGLGVLMHGTRVVEVGGADTAILRWIAEKDAAAR